MGSLNKTSELAEGIGDILNKKQVTVVLPKKNPLFSPPFHMIMWEREKIFNGIVAFSKIYLNIVTRCKKRMPF